MIEAQPPAYLRTSQALAWLPGASAGASAGAVAVVSNGCSSRRAGEVAGDGPVRRFLGLRCVCLQGHNTAGRTVGGPRVKKERTHPTWDNCQQLLQVLFTTEERERILNEARKLVLGAEGNPTTNQAQIDASFPLTRPKWDFNTTEGFQRTHEDIWLRLHAIYKAGPTPTHHQYRPGDWVYVKRHRQETLEPCWEGPYIVVLTTPTALKVDGIATWVHHTHVWPADPCSIRKDFVTQWAVN
ncbi:uncharacterized protein LOC131489639 [Neofelis nebulosa]|uniref:uncharacterized protein LOC131489639 n=1 Tax=Neofelis nebulosa TaxID=61452 RepID=UPI00272A2065|nr:uncharacterized protein LOC131489639 [Neofelis nebulosa]